MLRSMGGTDAYDRQARDEILAGALLTIDLEAVRANYRVLSRAAAPAHAAAVVKADAYGLGAARMALALMAEGCRTFFVAVASEGLDLRDLVGPGPDIHVLNGLPPGSERVAAAAGLTPVLNSLPQLASWREAAPQSGPRLPASLHVDTGMSRLGVSAEEAGRIAADPSATNGIDLALILSHLACAEDTENPANEAQLTRFEAARAKFPGVPASLANSSGIFLGQRYRFDMVRPGAALFGVNPTPSQGNPMARVVQLRAKVAQIRRLHPGDTVGYGRSFRAERAVHTATISLGYGDGWPRAAAAAAFFQGVRLPFLGRVSMDSIVIDISALPEGALQTGALVELIGPNQSVDDVARAAGTIGYEILTRLGQRPYRRYLGA